MHLAHNGRKAKKKKVEKKEKNEMHAPYNFIRLLDANTVFFSTFFFKFREPKNKTAKH